MQSGPRPGPLQGRSVYFGGAVVVVVVLLVVDDAGGVAAGAAASDAGGVAGGVVVVVELSVAVVVELVAVSSAFLLHAERLVTAISAAATIRPERGNFSIWQVSLGCDQGNRIIPPGSNPKDVLEFPKL